MQKQSNFFEQNVQWIALGLGGVFLLLMVFFYVLRRPVEVEVGNQMLGPGEVEKVTLTGPVADVDRDLRNSTIPEIKQVDYVNSFVATIKGTNQQIAQLSGNQINWAPAREGPGGTVVIDGPHKDGVIPALPVLPGTKAGPVRSGRSQVTFLDPNWVPNERKPNELQPAIDKDIDWASCSFMIDGRELLKAFNAAFDAKKVEEAGRKPADFMQTTVINVQLIRQQILPGNKAGKEEIIAPLKNDLTRPPFPGKNATEIEIMTYLNWATQNPDAVTLPPFFEVIGGEPWTAPDEQNERLAAEDVKARREEAKRRMEQARLDRRNQLEVRRQPRGLNPEEMMEEGGGADPRQPRPIRPPNALRPLRPGQQRQQLEVEPGKFNVMAEENIQIIAHDDTIEAGKTYRYKIRYHLLNPIYKSVRIAKPELSNQFAILSVDSDWTKPITMRPKVEFFLAKAGNDKADFDVFQMKDGQMKKSKATVGAGDAIGNSGWSVIDIRGTGGKSYLLVMDESGQVYRRDPESGNPSDRYFNLLEEVQPNIVPGGQ